MNKNARISIRVLLLMIVFCLFFVLAENSSQNISLENLSSNNSENDITGNVIRIQPIMDPMTEPVVEENITIPEVPNNETINLLPIEEVINETVEAPIEEPSLITTLLSILINKVSAVIGEVINIQAYLTDENDTPLVGQKIDFYADKKIGSEITNEDGKAEINLNTSSWSSGIYTITANYSGTGQWQASLISTDVTLEEPIELLLNETLADSTIVIPIKEINLKNSKGQTVEANVTYSKKQVSGSLSIASTETEVYHIDITPNQSLIKRIQLFDVDLTTDASLAFEEVPITIPAPTDLGTWAKVYAIDPTGINFTTGLVTVNSAGGDLYKCKDYDFQTQTCYGQWNLFISGLTPGEEYAFTLTAEDPVFAQVVSACTAEDSSVQGAWDTACDAHDGSLLTNDNSLVETHTFTKGAFAGLRIQSANTSITDCESITSVRLCYERWITPSTPDICDISIDANGGVSYTLVTAVCPGTTANPGVTCTDVTSIGETFVCTSFFGIGGTKALAKMENRRASSGGGTTETLSTDVFFFNVTYTITDTVFPIVTFVTPTPTNNSFQSSTAATVNATLTDNTAVRNCTLQFDGVNETMTETSVNSTYKICTTIKSSLTQGQHNITVFGNDSVNNINSTDRILFYVDNVNPAIQYVAPTETAGTFLAKNNILINVTATDTYLTNISIRLYNITGLRNTTTTLTSPNDINYTNLADGVYYFNATAFDNASNSNSTSTRDITIDTTYPAVVDLRPTVSSIYNASQTIQVAANITETNLASARVNVTYPNGTIQQLTLTLATGNKYNTSLTIPDLPGLYNLTFIVNDSAGNTNNTETTNFTANDIFPPVVIIVTPTPASNYNANTNVSITANITDQSTISVVLANITLPNSSIVQQIMSYNSTTGLYNSTFNQTLTTGTYTIRIIANDTYNNVNNTETRTFTVQDSSVPLVYLDSPANYANLSNRNVTFRCNVSDDTGLTNVTLYHNINGTFVANQTNNVSGLNNQTNFTINNINDGTYLWNCLARDTSNNPSFAGSNFTFSVDTTAPNVTNLYPLNTTTLILGNSISINVTVTDSFSVNKVLANLTLPNGTSQLLTLLNSTATLYNYTYTPLITGQHNITILANDSVGNLNNSETTFFKATLVPTVNLTFPANNSVYNSSLIEFNFTVTDDDTTLSNCTLYSNYSGVWQNESIIVSVTNGTVTNITKYVPDGTFVWNILCTDSLGYSNFSQNNFTLTVNTTLQGIFAYQELNVQSPKYRIWNNFNISGNELTNTQNVGGDITWSTIKGNHKRKEFILATEDKNNDINIQVYDVETKIWNNLQEVSTDVPNSAFRSFDIAYEDVSGRALIVYETSSVADSTVAYRLWNGTAYSTQQTLTTSLSSSPISWISLISQKGSDQIMLLVHSAANALYAVPWNGTAFDNSKNTTVSTGTITNTEQHFAFAWQEANNNGIVTYGEGNNLQYKTFNETTWSIVSSISLGDNLATIRLCSAPSSNYIGLIYQTALTHVGVRMWNGTAFLSSPPSEDSSTEPNGANNINVDCLWLNSTQAVFGFVDAGSAAMDYFTFTQANTWSTADLTSTSTTSNFATSNIASLKFSKNPLTNVFMVTAMDTSEDLSALWWDGANFQTISASPFEQSTEVLNGDQEGFMFDWLRYDTVPNVTNLNLSSTSINTSDSIIINVTVVDDVAVSVVLANITVSGVSVQTITLTDDNLDNIYNGTITNTITPGTYTITIIANDTSTHQNINNTETTTFVVSDNITPAVVDLRPVADSSYNILSPIEIAANVTDNGNVSRVGVNVTYPNSTVQQVNLSLTTGNRYNGSFVVPAILGRFNLTFIANDTNNNINSTETTYFNSVDGTKPTITLNYPVNGFNTSVNNINFNWTATDDYHQNLTCNLTIDNIVNTTLNVTSAVTSNHTVSGFSDGAHNWNVTCWDDSNNFNTSETRSFSIDTTNPAIQYETPTETNNTYLTRSYLQINVSSTDSGLGLSNITIYLHNSTVQLYANTTLTSPNFINYTNLNDDTYYFNATSYDVAGNSNSTETRTVVLDTTNPAISFATPTTSAGNQSQNYIEANITFSDTNLDTAIIYLHNSTGLVQSNISTTSPLFINFTSLPEGTYYLNATVNDTAGNTNNTATRTITLDTTNPALAFATPTTTSGNYSQSYIEINITFSDTNLGTARVYLYNSTGLYQSNTSTTSPLFVNFTSLPEGTYYLNATVNDTAGNANNTATKTIVLDRSSPVITSITSTPTVPIYNNGSEQNVSINFSSNEFPINITFYLYNSTGSMVNSSGPTILSSVSSLPINYTIINTLGDGNYSLNLTVVDPAGNNDTKNVGTIVIDATYPTAGTNTPTLTSGNYSYSYIYANISTVEQNLKNITINIYNSTGDLVATNSSTTSPFFWNYSGLSDGIYYWNSTIYDLARNTNSTDTQTIGLDTTNPAISSATPTTASGNYSQSYIEANITASDSNLEIITINLYNTTGLYQNNTSTTSPLFVNFTSLPDGTYYLNATVNDTAGNSNSTTTSTIVLDTSNPIVSLVSPVNNTLELTSHNINFIYNVTDVTSNIKNCSLSLNGTPIQSDNTITKNINQTISLTLANGDYNWSVSCYDNVGNLGQSTTYNLSMSVTAPTITLESPEDDYFTANNSVVFNCSATDDSSLVNLTLYVWNSTSSVYYTNTTNLGGTANSTTWTTSLLTDSIYIWNCLAFDDSELSDTAPSNRTLTIDPSAPTISLNYPENGFNTTSTSINFNWTTTDNYFTALTCNITVDGSVNVSTVATTNGTAKNQSVSGFSDGTHNWNVTCWDGVNNTNTSTTRTFRVDTTSPSLVVSSPTEGTNYSTTNISLNYTAADSGMGIDTCWYTNVTGQNTTLTSCQNTTFLANQGSNNITMYVNDSLNNLNYSTIIFAVDTISPIVSLESPANNTLEQTTNSIIFNYNTTDVTSTIDNCSLYINDLINDTNTSITEDTTQNFSKTIDSGYYNWSIRCTDSFGNVGNSSVWYLNVSITAPTATLVSPADNYYSSSNSVSFNCSATSNAGLTNTTLYVWNSTAEYYTNTTNISGTSNSSAWTTSLTPDGNYSWNCLVYDNSALSDWGDTNRTVTIDTTNPAISSASPTTASGNYSQSYIEANITASDTNLDLITIYLYNTTEIYQTNTSTTSPLFVNITSLPDGTYYLNATVNDTAGNLNSTATSTIVLDTTPPAIFNLTPSAGSTQSYLADIEISANITDQNNVNASWINITYPNSSTELLTLNATAGDKYNTSVTANQIGTYLIYFFANDSLNNLNDTETTNFTVSDAVSPTITILGCTPSSTTLGQSTQCVATITDDIILANVTANVTMPNGTVINSNVSNIASNYYFTFTNTVLIYQYNITWFANDTSGNTQTATDNFTISDTSLPQISLNSPDNGLNSSSTSIIFNFTATDDALTAMNCSVLINDTINQTNSSTINGTETSFTISGFINGTYNWNINCTDNSNNSNISETRTFAIDTAAPNFISLTTSPSTEADLDPGVNVTILANITDNTTAVQTIIFQRKLSNDSIYTNDTGTYNSSSELYYAIFNASQNGTYNLRLWANDSAGNGAYSNIVNISVQYEHTWTRAPSVFTPLSAVYGDNVSLGNLTINNTGDFEFNFTIVSDSNVTTYNETQNFTLAAKGIKTIQVNDSATSAGIKIITLNISANPNANPTSQTTTGTIVVVPGQPILVATFTTPTTETLTQTQGDTNIEFVARLENIGEGNASNVTFFIDLPTGWLVTFGQLNQTFSQLDAGDYQELSIEVTIPSNAATGIKSVIANATGFNSSGSNLNNINNNSLIFSDLVMVTVNALPTVLGAAAVTTPSGGGPAPSGGAGGVGSGGGVGETILRTIEIIKVKRGTSQTVPFEIKNIYENATLTNVKLNLTGFMSQYISWTPSVLNNILYLNSKNFIFTIFVPDYLTAAEYNLTATIKADIIPLNPKAAGFSKKSVTEYRTIILKIEEVDIVDLSKYIDSAEQCIKEMNEAKFPISRVNNLLEQAANHIKNEQYKYAQLNLEQICQIKDKAFIAYNLLLELEKQIEEAQLKGIDIPNTYQQRDLARLAFDREDFDLSVQRAKDAQLTYVLETKGKFNVLNFVKNNYLWIIISILPLLALIFFAYKKTRVFLIRKHTKDLNKEEDTIRNLVLELQKSYLKDKTISDSQYKRQLTQYETRISKIKQTRTKLRNERAALFDPKQELIDLKKEREDIQKAMKKLQENYFIYEKISKSVFKSEHKSNNGRLAEIKLEEETLNLRIKQSKIKSKASAALNKITDKQTYTNIFKKNKIKPKIRRKRGR
ncbi:hypothetical protein COY27_05430 [Candidatus Woesearchaeota archaeon CG_4_10_14_0_2_um_filter_33_13]|nr:MAG: hypothetical protein COY27_05430 [Candidatus Woesearchaeota archaeon CG_4_10_14_0_2_um_filter_33_13]